MALPRQVLVVGVGGTLGRHVARIFSARQWHVIGDTASKDIPLSHCVVHKNWAFPTAEDYGNQLLLSLSQVLRIGTSQSRQLDAVINVSGGFTLGDAADPDLMRHTRLMVEQSLYSSIVAVQAASRALKPGGLLILRGAGAARGPTPRSLPYGVAKVAVHHLVRSLADAEAVGLPAGVRTIGLAPGLLDIPENRQAMPDADRSAWATPEEVAGQLEVWCTDPSQVESGRIYLVDKSSGHPAEYVVGEPL